MTLFHKLKASISRTNAFQQFIKTTPGGFLLAHFGRWWPARIKDVLASPDNQFIPRVPEAGRVIGNTQVMHNGLRIVRGSYYGYPNTRLLRLTGGVHEPQEERAFAEILKLMPSGAVMLELGAFWAFYSMWFYQQVSHATCYMVDPDSENLEFGRRNFTLNEMKGSFTQAFVGDSSSAAPGGTPTIAVDSFAAERGIERLNILHSDIQGYEAQMLQGAAKMLAARRIDYIFISTHSNDLHRQCIAYLQGCGYLVLAECDLDETYSVDGLIVARSPAVDGATSLSLSKKPRPEGSKAE